MSCKPKSKSTRWNKNLESAQFIVRQVVNGSVSLKEPRFESFIRENPSFGSVKDRNLRRNFRNTVERWRNFVESGQGKNMFLFTNLFEPTIACYLYVYLIVNIIFILYYIFLLQEIIQKIF